MHYSQHVSIQQTILTRILTLTLTRGTLPLKKRKGTKTLGYETSDIQNGDGGAENARVENAGAITYGKPSNRK